MNLYKYHTNPAVLKHSDKPREHVVPSEVFKRAAKTSKRDPRLEQMILQGNSSIDPQSYIQQVLRHRWPEYEKKLIKQAKAAKPEEYTSVHGNTRYPAVIEKLMEYHEFVLNFDTWPEAEEIYARYPSLASFSAFDEYR
jgi:hypothetical protein